jgi:membrane-associated phospholipid phosphatase
MAGMDRIRPWMDPLGAWTRRHPRLAGFVYVAAFCALSMLLIDQPVARYFKSAITPETFGFFRTITVLGDASGFIAVGAVAVLAFKTLAHFAITDERFLRYRRLGRVALFFLSVMLASGALILTLKFVIGRLRPRYLFESGLYGFQPFNWEWAMNSFPSGHSQAIFAAMTALWVIYPRYDVAYFILAGLIAFSRVPITVHYVSDTVMGAFLAIIVTLWVRDLFEARGASPRIRPERDRKLIDL